MDYKEKKYDTILLELDEGVLTVTNNLPDQRNALTMEWMREFRPVLQQLAVDPEVKVLVITGAGKAFCAGGNVKEFVKAPKERTDAHPLCRPLWNIPTMSTEERLEKQTMSGKKIFLQLATMGKPVIAAINGPAAGAGFDMACACDLRYMADNASLISSFVRIGIVPIDGGLWHLMRIVGTTRAFEIMYTGREVGAEEAARIGLANAVFPKEELLPSVMAVAKKLAKGPSISYALTKYYMRKSWFWDLPQAFDEFYNSQEILFNSHDNREGIMAMLEKRAPQFLGE